MSRLSTQARIQELCARRKTGWHAKCMPASSIDWRFKDTQVSLKADEERQIKVCHANVGR